VQPSQRVQRYRGRPAESDDRVQRLWLLIEERGSFRYEINRDHPLIATLAEQLPQDTEEELSELIAALESTFPVEDAYNRLSEDIAHDPPSVNLIQLANQARALHAAMSCDVDALAQRLALVEPFTQIPDLSTFLRGAIDDGQP
jgi:hypothetical protein